MHFEAQVIMTQPEAELEIAAVVAAKYPMPGTGKWESRYQSYGFRFVFVPDKPAADVPVDQEAA
jgi:hypothetical protein